MAKKEILTTEICQNCGNTFKGGRYALLCVDCRKRLLSDSAKKRGLSKLGQEARKKVEP